MLPAWLPSPASLPGREDCVLAVEAMLARGGTCLVVGRPGSGTTSVAGRVAARSGKRILACSFAGALDEADVSLLVGYALGVPSPGDESSVHAALRTCAGALLVADEISEAAWNALRTLVTLAPDLQAMGTLRGSWDGRGQDPVLTAPDAAPPPADASPRRSPLEARGVSIGGGVPFPNALPGDFVTVPPLAPDLRATLFPAVPFAELDALDLGDNLLAARLCASGVAPATLSSRLRDTAWLAAWPTGLPGVRVDDLPALSVVRDARRTRVRAGVRPLALVGARPPRGRDARRNTTAAWKRASAPRLVPGRAALALRGPWYARQWTDPRTQRALATLLQIADGAHPRLDPLPDDYFLLRAVGLRARETAFGVRALIAAARVAQALGAIPAARDLLRHARARSLGHRSRGLDTSSPHESHARVAWAEGELLLSTGQVSAALAARDEAGAAFLAARDPHGHAVMLRQAGDRALQRGEVWLADTAFTAAARLDANAVASERASQAVVRALRDEAGDRTHGTNPDAVAAPGTAHSVALRLESLARAVDARESGRAVALLGSLQTVAEFDRRVAATLLHRRAELALRSDAIDLTQVRTASALALEAAAAWARQGERVAEASAWRVAGDAHALEGDLAAARSAYARAIDRQLRTQDLRGLARTLARLARVEDALGNPDEAERRRGEEQAVRRLVGEN